MIHENFFTYFTYVCVDHQKRPSETMVTCRNTEFVDFTCGGVVVATFSALLTDVCHFVFFRPAMDDSGDDDWGNDALFEDDQPVDQPVMDTALSTSLITST